MDTQLNEKEVRALAKKIGKGIKTEGDLADFTKMMRKVVVETAMDVEMDEHLGYEKHSVEGAMVLGTVVTVRVVNYSKATTVKSR